MATTYLKGVDPKESSVYSSEAQESGPKVWIWSHWLSNGNWSLDRGWGCLERAHREIKRKVLGGKNLKDSELQPLDAGGGSWEGDCWGRDREGGGVVQREASWTPRRGESVSTQCRKVSGMKSTEHPLEWNTKNITGSLCTRVLIEEWGKIQMKEGCSVNDRGRKRSDKCRQLFADLAVKLRRWIGMHEGKDGK